MFEQIRGYLDKRQAEKALCRVIEHASSYKEMGLPPGSPQYQQLLEIANDILSKEAARSGQTVARLELEAPALYRLREWAETEPPKRQLSFGWGSVGWAALALAFIPFVFGGMTGLYHVGGQLIMRLWHL